jgi:signal transduction histidine kinase
MNWSRYAKQILGLDDSAVATAGAVAALAAMVAGAAGYLWAASADQATAALACLFTALASALSIAAFWHTARMRAKAIAAIRHALLAVAAGETDLEAVSVAQAFGNEARVWNSLLEELLTLRRDRCVRLALNQDGTSASRDDGLRSACDAVWHGLIVTDASLRIIYANGAAAVFLGVKRDTTRGTLLTDLITDPPARAGVASMAATDGASESRSRFVIETSLLTGREEGTFRLSARRCSGRAGMIVVIEDISQQRVANNSRNAFVTQATHELRTPLTNIRLCVETLVDKADMEPVQRGELLNTISGESRRLERLVGDMLCVSEIEAGTMRLVRDDLRVEETIRQLEADFKHPASVKQVELSFTLGPKLPVILADRDKVVLAISNLVGNALKYTPAGGSVNVSTHTQGGALLVEVADTGLGIASAEHDLVFDRFYRAKDERVANITGSGLGLALARQVIRLHGGDITLQSELNKGSTFTLSIPMTTPVPLAA